MTIDERLEKLTERHEALAQALELMQHIWEERARESAREWEEQSREWNERWKKNGERLDKITTAIEQDAENIRGLARIAEIHGHRLSRLEGGPE